MADAALGIANLRGHALPPLTVLVYDPPPTIGHPAARWLILLLPAAVLLAAAPATAQTRVPMEFPPTGTPRRAAGGGRRARPGPRRADPAPAPGRPLHPRWPHRSRRRILRRGSVPPEEMSD